ncbi:MAG: cellulose biosynthesis protein BcsS [Candidatus Cybelea sp.]
MPLRSRTSLLTTVAATGFFVLAGFAAAPAADNAAVFAGGQLDFSNYVFAGVTLALPGSTIENGVAVRILGDTGGYNYVSNPIGTVKANFTGGELDGVYAFTHKDVWADFGAGVNYTSTNLTPNDPSNKLEGDQTELRLLTDGGTSGNQWRVDWDGYYGTRLQDYEAFVGVTHSLSQYAHLGVEGYFEGNPSYSLEQVGPLAIFATGPRGELRLSSGVAWESGFSTPRVYLKALYYQRI